MDQSSSSNALQFIVLAILFLNLHNLNNLFLYIVAVKTSISVKNQMQNRNMVEKVVTSFVPPQQSSQHPSLLGSSDPYVKPKLVDEKLVPKGNIISNPVLKSTTAASGTRTDPPSNPPSNTPSNTVSQFKMAPVKHSEDAKPAVSSLTKPSISANLPSDLKVHLLYNLQISCIMQ